MFIVNKRLMFLIKKTSILMVKCDADGTFECSSVLLSNNRKTVRFVDTPDCDTVCYSKSANDFVYLYRHFNGTKLSEEQVCQLNYDIHWILEENYLSVSKSDGEFTVDEIKLLASNAVKINRKIRSYDKKSRRINLEANRKARVAI